MLRRTRIFVVAIDEDPIPGGFDKDHIFSDVDSMLKNAIPHYNPRVVDMGSYSRESNFIKDVTLEYELPLTHITFFYPAERDTNAG